MNRIDIFIGIFTALAVIGEVYYVVRAELRARKEAEDLIKKLLDINKRLDANRRK